MWCIVYSEKRTWDVRFVFRCLWCVCAWCVVLCMWRGLARGKPPVCRFKTPPCVGSKRLRVYRQNARICYHMRAFCGYTRKRFEPTHGCVLNPHTGGLSLSFASSSLPSFSFSSLSLLFLSLSARFSFLFCLQSSSLCFCSQ